MVAILSAIGFGGNADGMVFKSDTVTAQWDTWCFYHDGTYYLYYLVTEKTGEGFCVASSKDGANWKRRHGVNRKWKFGKTASIRLLMRRGMMEVYLDDHFMECWTMGCHRAKKGTVIIPNLPYSLPDQAMKVWQMTLRGWDEEKNPQKADSK